MPWPSNIQVTLLSSIFEDLNLQEMNDIYQHLTVEELPGCGHQTTDVYSVLHTPEIAATEKSTKWLMKWVNSCARGTVLNFDGDEVRAK